MRILTRKQIEQAVSYPEILAAIEKGFILYSKGDTTIPSVAALHFDNPPGDCHIKYGYAKEGKYYVVKIASGFSNNPTLGLPSCQGLMLLFDKQTGALAAVLLDEGYLTDLRTAAAGCLAAQYLAPKQVSCIGIVGTGAQAYYQLKFLSLATSCRKVIVWGRDPAKAQKIKEHIDLHEWHIEIAKDINELTDCCNLIVTTTSATTPLLSTAHIKPGTHITAMGADDIGKQELDPAIFTKADKVIVDSRNQCLAVGDVACAVQAETIQPNSLVELGEVAMNLSLGRTSENEITVACLTGVAIQDLQIASTILKKINA